MAKIFHWSQVASAALLAAPLVLLSNGAAQAQRDGFPPGNVPGVHSGRANPAGQLLRINRLENRIRAMTGQIEQLQFQMRKMQKQLEAFQKDVDFRFKDQPGKSRPARRRDRSSADPQPGNDRRERNAGRQNAPDASAGPLSNPNRRDVTGARNLRKKPDVFDPAANPAAPGAPRQLGSAANRPSNPLSNPLGNPLPAGPLDRRDPDKGLPQPDSPTILSRPLVTNSPTPGAARVAPPDATPRETYNVALAALRKRRYSDAQTGFSTFLKRFPNSTLTPSARYHLGIVYASRSKHRQAAEQFLKVSTDHRKSSRAPNSLYRLGLSLERLGAREQACASYAEVERRYPLAPGSLRVRVERRMQKAKC